MDQQVPQDKQVPTALQANSAILVKRALQAKGATRVKWATPVKLGPMAQKVTWDKEVTRVQRGLKAKWVPPGLKDCEVIRVKKETQVIPVPKAPLEHKVQSAQKAPSVPRVKWEQPAQWVLKGLAVRWVLKVWLA